jgi:hypothetical protein
VRSLGPFLGGLLLLLLLLLLRRLEGIRGRQTESSYG